jgi:flagellar assembly factor FliW
MSEEEKSEEEKIAFANAKFGEVEIERDNVVEFPNGVPGFERCKRYGLLSLEDEAPFLRLLSIDDPNVGFVLMNPMQVWGDYNPDLGKEDLASLQLEGAEDLAIYCVVTLSSVPTEMTANLKGPIFINTRTMKARQMILMDERYHTKHLILGES